MYKITILSVLLLTGFCGYSQQATSIDFDQKIKWHYSEIKLPDTPWEQKGGTLETSASSITWTQHNGAIYQIDIDSWQGSWADLTSTGEVAFMIAARSGTVRFYRAADTIRAVIETTPEAGAQTTYEFKITQLPETY